MKGASGLSSSSSLRVDPLFLSDLLPQQRLIGMGRAEQLVVIVALLFTEDASPPEGSGLALSEAAGDPSSKKILGHLLLVLLRGTQPFL